MSPLKTKLPPHRGHHLHRKQSARDLQPSMRAPKVAGQRPQGAFANIRANALKCINIKVETYLR
eukprot:1906986-Pleurochrysis_carterae.AAC.1